MATDSPNEKVLFALRVNADGSTTVTTSAEWDAYHAGRGTRSGRGPRPARHTRDLRAALTSLETIYNDLYTEAHG